MSKSRDDISETILGQASLPPLEEFLGGVFILKDLEDERDSFKVAILEVILYDVEGKWSLHISAAQVPEQQMTHEIDISDDAVVTYSIWHTGEFRGALLYR